MIKVPASAPLLLRFAFPLFLLLVLIGCSPARPLARTARQTVLNDEALRTAHVGISLYEPATGRYWYNYQGDKYFVPASNTKIPTCYAALKYLGDSLTALRYRLEGDDLYLEPTGDPSFLLPEFSRQPALTFLQQTGKRLVLSTANWQDAFWGNGWAWNDYTDDYMAERSALPLYGNVVRISGPQQALQVVPAYFRDSVRTDKTHDGSSFASATRRSLAANEFELVAGATKESRVDVPFSTRNGALVPLLLADTLHKTVTLDSFRLGAGASVLHSQPTDSLLRPMMHRSDNFFAEQSLLMVSNTLLGVMSDSRVIDTLLKTDFRDLPQRPRWVDGSGLSRYNLFTPQDMVAILDKMQRDFGMLRVKTIFPTGGTGTLGSYYKSIAGSIYAKTGSLSGVVALSGFLYTHHNKLLVFSVLVNNHQASATAVRRAVEKFLLQVQGRY